MKFFCISLPAIVLFGLLVTLNSAAPEKSSIPNGSNDAPSNPANNADGSNVSNNLSDPGTKSTEVSTADEDSSVPRNETTISTGPEPTITETSMTGSTKEPVTDKKNVSGAKDNANYEHFSNKKINETVSGVSKPPIDFESNNNPSKLVSDGKHPDNQTKTTEPEIETTEFSNATVVSSLPRVEATSQPEIATNKSPKDREELDLRRQDQEMDAETTNVAGSSMVINVSSGSLMAILLAYLLF